MSDRGEKDSEQISLCKFIYSALKLNKYKIT